MIYMKLFSIHAIAVLHHRIMQRVYRKKLPIEYFYHVVNSMFHLNVNICVNMKRMQIEQEKWSVEYYNNIIN